MKIRSFDWMNRLWRRPGMWSNRIIHNTVNRLSGTLCFPINGLEDAAFKTSCNASSFHFRDSGNKRSLSCGNGWLLGINCFPRYPRRKTDRMMVNKWFRYTSDKIIRDLMLSGNCKYVWNDVYCLQRTPPCLSEYVVCWYFNYTSFYRGCLSFVQYFGFAHL